MAENSKMQQLQTLLDTYTYCMCLSVPAKTLKVCKVYSYNDLWTLAKPQFCCSSSVELAYHESGTSTVVHKRPLRAPMSIRLRT